MSSTLITLSYSFFVIIIHLLVICIYFFFFQAEDGIRDYKVTGVQTCALPISDCSAGPGAGMAEQSVPGAQASVPTADSSTSRVAPPSEEVAGVQAAGQPSGSEKGRVGKGCRFRWLPYPYKKKRPLRGDL